MPVHDDLRVRVGDVLGTPNVVLDPSRIAAQVVSGVGFLGGGAIVLQHEMVRGLTTAASIWAVAAVGLTIGGGMYIAGFVATAISPLILIVLKLLENRLELSRSSPTIRVLFHPGNWRCRPSWALSKGREWKRAGFR